MLNRIKFGAVGRQDQGCRAESLNRVSHLAHPVDSQTIHDDDVSWLETGSKVVVDELDHPVAVHGSGVGHLGAEAVRGDGANNAEASAMGVSLDDRRRSRTSPAI